MAATTPGETATGGKLSAIVPAETDHASAVDYLSALATIGARATIAMNRGIHDGTFPQEAVAEAYGRSLSELAEAPDDPVKKLQSGLLAQNLSTRVIERIHEEVRSTHRSL